MFRIGQLSKMAKLSVPAIRFYEEKGLITPVNVDKWTGYRYYDETSLKRLNEIAYYKSLGFSLDEIRNLDENTIRNKIESSKKNLETLSKNISILSSFKKNEGGSMKKSEIVREILRTLEENHLNLYHSTAQTAVNRFIDSLDWDNFSEEDFDFYMQKLFAKFSDSQTRWNIKYLPLDNKLRLIQNELYLASENGKVIKLCKIEDKTTNQIVDMLKTLIPYETTECFIATCEQFLNNGYIYKLLELEKDGKFTLETEDGKSITTSIIPKKVASKTSGKPPYEHRILDNNILYIRYRFCKDNPDNPFTDFATNLEKQIKEKQIKKYILDVRSNGGGNSAIFAPLLAIIKQHQLRGAILVNAFTYGSPVLNIASLKESCQINMIGEPLSMSTIRYGETKHLSVEGYDFSVSTKLFDISQTFGYKGTIMPDYIVPLTAEDINSNHDSQLKKAIELLQ